MADASLLEEWRPVEGWPDYEVSSRGRVRRATDAWAGKGAGYIKYPRGHLMRAFLSTRGYLTINLRRPDGRRTKALISRLVCEAFNGPASTPRHQAAHWDGNETNNIPTNLRWATCGENHSDKLRHGTYRRKLSEAEVRQIKTLLASGALPVEMAARFDIARTTVHDINNGRRWARIK
jgi:NUMOD4 motif/HNH endonuclease